MAVEFDGVDEFDSSRRAFYSDPLFSPIRNGGIGDKEEIYGTKPTEIEDRIGHLWKSSRDHTNTGYSGGGGISVEWGDPKGPTFSGYAQAEVHHGDTKVEAKVEQKDDGSGKASVSASHSPKHENEGNPK